MSTEVPIVATTTSAPVNNQSTLENSLASSSQQKRRQPRQNRPNTEGAPKPPRRPRQPKDAKPSNEASTPSSVVDGEPKTNSQPRNPRKKKPVQAPANADGAPPPPRNRRAANFGAGLTNPDERQNQSSRDKEPGHSKNRRLPQGDDLTSSLIRNLSTPPYPDCPICFSSIRPDQAIWSCSPSIPIVTSSENQVAQYCWTSFHVKCIRSWADKSVKEVADAWRARGEPNKGGDWRCPGCQAKREAVPSGYWYVTASSHRDICSSHFTGAFAIPPLSPNVFVSQHPIHVGIHVLVCAKVDAAIRAPYSAIPALVRLVKLPPVWSVIVQRKISSASVVE
ncbi:NF-X1-type zinc finger protein NFXL1 [Psilocybe cubensis]|uniref:NF-X1-type zinc finger protein NFXL1 n=1 Tax=Psilocybe cubensis TaxID=181762 RepID=A0ACB8GQQ9_PSICU|nr:NF-X1-type zinc finger protein NFXL1 [Psilocybe cubensis]KAH9477551.1 NF-X1-type zinc finger protein NFXL1 [Psilocybe cubensis]